MVARGAVSRGKVECSMDARSLAAPASRLVVATVARVVAARVAVARVAVARVAVARVAVARVAAACLAAACVMVACAPPPGAEGDADDEPEEELPLRLAVDSVDVVHGALRVIATMTEGSADVSVRLGGDCEHREAGGGLSTISTLVWAFGEEDLADAIDCGLVVRARVREGRRYVAKRAELAVSASVSPPAEESTEGSTESTEDDVPARSPQIIVAVQSAETAETTDPGAAADTSETPEAPSYATIDVARAALLGRPLVVDGVACAVSLDVGGTPLQAEP
jgi:hypothetical protein